MASKNKSGVIVATLGSAADFDLPVNNFTHRNVLCLTDRRHTMHRTKSIACFRDFDPSDNKAFDRKPHLKALRDEHSTTPVALLAEWSWSQHCPVNAPSDRVTRAGNHNMPERLGLKASDVSIAPKDDCARCVGRGFYYNRDFWARTCFCGCEGAEEWTKVIWPCRFAFRRWHFSAISFG